jgi:tetratricopeptide (TPR) repeat protein
LAEFAILRFSFTEERCRVRPSWSLVLAVAATLVAPSPGLADEGRHGHALPERFGTVHVVTSCKADLAAAFDRGVALLHSFAYKEAAQAFEEIAAKDPDCAMAPWGVAMSYFHPVWGPSTPAEMDAGRKAAQRAAALEAMGTPRERDLIAAIGAFYAGIETPHATRVVAYEKAMAGLAERHPDDREIAIFHALALLGVAYNSPPDKTYAKQKQAAKILNALLPGEPDHPGISHYMIHSFDFPELAELALPAANAYAKIAPSAPHALHMPSHIFTRLGMWPESIESNLASAQTAQAWLAKTQPGATAFDALHAMDYLEYAYLQSGQDAKARALVDSVDRVASLDKPVFQAGYALAAIPARYALEHRDWKAAASLAVKPASYPWDKFSYQLAILEFAHAVGAARSGDVTAARAAVTKLEALRASLDGQKGFDWATQVEIQRRAAAGWLARAEKKDDEAVKLMRSAADLEDQTDKHPVTPGAILPAREQLADLLLELGKPAEALAEYETSLKSAPARLNSFVGAAQAASRAGQKEKAKAFHDKLVAVCGGTVPDRVAAEMK